MAHRQKRYREAGTLLKQALSKSNETGGRELISLSLAQIVWLNARQECHATAARLFGASQSLRDKMKIPVGVFIKAEYNQIVSEVRAHLGDEAFAAEWQAGMSMETEQAVECALAAVSPQSQA